VGPRWVRRGAENLALTGIRSLDRPARSDYAIPAQLSKVFLIFKTQTEYVNNETYFVKKFFKVSKVKLEPRIRMIFISPEEFLAFFSILLAVNF
jgi:hypothetical protein